MIVGAYAGDLKGNVWKFDLSSTTASLWDVAFSGSPMYTARDDADNVQPITAGLALAREPVSGRRWVFVGTGKFMETSDVADMRTQSMYGLIDNDTSVITGRTSAGNGTLQERSFVLAGTFGGKPVRSFETAGLLDSSKRGWYLDLELPPNDTQEGERIVSNPRVFGSVLHGKDREGSDLDLLVDPTPEISLLDIARLQNRLEALLGTRVDVLTPKALPADFRNHIIAEARPV